MQDRASSSAGHPLKVISHLSVVEDVDWRRWKTALKHHDLLGPRAAGCRTKHGTKGRAIRGRLHVFNPRFLGGGDLRFPRLGTTQRVLWVPLCLSLTPGGLRWPQGCLAHPHFYC